MTEPILHSVADADIDRDTYCTPREWTRAIGPVDVDPCSNERATVLARRTFRLDRGQNGLVLARFVARRELVFINPPYSAGQVVQWVEAYRRKRFIFLVRLDPSTGWFAELARWTSLLLIPRTRLAFEAPPGLEEGASVFPHGLFYARAEDATPAVRALCYPWRPDR